MCVPLLQLIWYNWTVSPSASLINQEYSGKSWHSSTRDLLSQNLDFPVDTFIVVILTSRIRFVVWHLLLFSSHLTKSEFIESSVRWTNKLKIPQECRSYNIHSFKVGGAGVWLGHCSAAGFPFAPVLYPKSLASTYIVSNIVNLNNCQKRQ